MEDYKVYCHTNKANGKKYIGITARDVSCRWKNGKGYKQDSYLRKAIDKYGWDAFTHEILFSGLTKNEAEQKEIELISFYDTTNKLRGYNIKPGGNANMHLPDSVKLNISKAKTGHKFSKDICEAMSKRRKGIKFSEEHRRHMSMAETGSKNHRYGKPALNRVKVICLETGEIFDSISLAGESVGVDRRSISDAVRGRHKTCAGKHWAYLEEVI